jgi:Zn-finger nucleic acid-binding protein
MRGPILPYARRWRKTLVYPVLMCPQCGEPMLILELEGIELDRCDRCGGTWLDAGELGLILERSGASSDPLGAALNHAADQGASRRRCPRCRKKLREILMTGKPGLSLERCRKGHGVWCERGEMSTLLEGFSTQSAISSFLAGVYPAANH